MAEDVDPENTSAETVGPGDAQPTPFVEIVRRQPAWAIFGGMALILVVGLVAGMAIGWKIEQRRVKSDVARIKANHSNSADKTGGSGNAANKSVRVLGTVTAVSGNSLTVSVASGAARKLNLTSDSRVEEAVADSSTPLASGMRVVWTNQRPSKTKAAEIIVVPSAAKLGVTLTAASSTTMTYRTAKGDTVVTTTGATKENATTATPAAIKVGQTVLMRVQGLARVTDLIVLPAATTFQ
jgi:hypothetical protein